MEKSTTFSAPFLRSLLPPDTEILRPIICFRVKTTEIDNQYDIYSRTCAYGSYILEGDEFTVSYAPVSGICPLRIIIAIAYAEGLVIFVLDIYNAFYNTMLADPAEKVYLRLPYLYMDWLKKTSISLNKSEVIIHSENKFNTRNKTCWKILV